MMLCGDDVWCYVVTVVCDDMCGGDDVWCYGVTQGGDPGLW